MCVVPPPSKSIFRTFTSARIRIFQKKHPQEVKSSVNSAMGSFISQPEDPKSKQAGMIWFETQSIQSLSKGYLLWCKSELQRQVTREELELFFGIPVLDGRTVVKILAKDKDQTKVDVLEFVLFACLMSKMITWKGKSRLLATLFDFNQDNLLDDGEDYRSPGWARLKKKLIK